jgi:23S rRNA (uracil1939-C5)-methyltransferase
VVEINPHSIELFKKVLANNNITNAFAVAGDAETEASAIIKEKQPDVIILDPPRKGVHADVLKSVIENGIPEIIYISCNPMTFARDVKELKGHYELVETVPVDLFPQTYHVETMGYFKRIQA